MRVFAICQDELVIRSLDDVSVAGLRGRFPRREPAPRASPPRRGIQVTAGDPRRIDTYLKADITPGTCFIVEDNARAQHQESHLERFATPAAR